MTIVAYSHGWLAVTFDRTYGWPVEKYALYNGLTLIVMGPLSVMFAGWLSDRYTQRGVKDAPMRIALLGLFLSTPLAVIAPLLDNGMHAFIVMASANVGLAFILFGWCHRVAYKSCRRESGRRQLRSTYMCD